MIYYIGYFNDAQQKNENRIISPAAENKMSYILSVLSEVFNEKIEIISPAETKKNRFVKGKRSQLSEQVILKTFTSFSSNNRCIRLLGHILTRVSFAKYLLKKINSEDQVIVYHSLAYRHLIKLIKFIKKCKLTLEVEEIYADVTGNQKLREKEIQYLQIADNYIFITRLLRDKVNCEKMYAISHGTYKRIPDMGVRFDDGKIHVVYAGTFSREKGGVFTAISAAEYLDHKYVLEILGSGSNEEVEAVKKEIADISSKTDCKINYVGFKSGDDFNSYIQACHIGLSTQQAEAQFNDTSFPSKILMYMSNGIKVVSVRIPAIETSDVGKYIYYYENQDSKNLANAIISVDLSEEFDSRQILDDLNREFCENLLKLKYENSK